MQTSTVPSGQAAFHTAEAELFSRQFRALQMESGRIVPPRKAFSPHATRKLLPYLAIMEVREPGIIFVRLVGTAVINRGRVDMTGKDLLDFCPEGIRDWTLQHHRHMLATPCGSTFLSRERFDSILVYTEIVNYPFADDDGVPRFVLGIAVEIDRKELMLRGESAMRLDAFVEQRYLDIGAGIGSGEH